jgi:primary-amine oxidase
MSLPRRFPVLAAGVMGALSALANPEPAWACTNPASTLVANVNHVFPVGSQWQFSVNRHGCLGLDFLGIFYTPAGGVTNKVLHRASLAEVHVPYVKGNPRFLDLTQDTQGLGHHAVALAAAECPDGTLLDGNRICMTVEDDGYAWKLSNTFRRRQTLSFLMSSQLGQYNYITKWDFHDDGTIEPHVGLTGALQIVSSGAGYLPYGSRVNAQSLATPAVGIAHYHNFYYRLDFDIAGADNDVVMRMGSATSFTPSPDSACANGGECRTIFMSPIATEGAQVFSATQHTSWAVFDRAVTNADGRTLGYEIAPHVTGLYRGMTGTTEPWSIADAWITAYNGCEQYAVNNSGPRIPGCPATTATNLSQMANAQVTNGVDVVFWYVQQLLHIPRDEDQSRMPIEWASFEIKPRSFHHVNPAP